MEKIKELVNKISQSPPGKTAVISAYSMFGLSITGFLTVLVLVILKFSF